MRDKTWKLVDVQQEEENEGDDDDAKQDPAAPAAPSVIPAATTTESVVIASARKSQRSFAGKRRVRSYYRLARCPASCSSIVKRRGVENWWNVMSWAGRDFLL